MSTLLLSVQSLVLFSRGGAKTAGWSEEENNIQHFQSSHLENHCYVVVKCLLNIGVLSELRCKYPFSSDFVPFSLLLKVICPVTIGVSNVG